MYMMLICVLVTTAYPVGIWERGNLLHEAKIKLTTIILILGYHWYVLLCLHAHSYIRRLKTVVQYESVKAWKQPYNK